MVTDQADTRELRRGGSAPLRTGCFLFLCCITIVFGVLYAIGSENFVFLLLAIILCIPFLLTFIYNVRRLEISLERLARGLPLHVSATRRRWPLTHLFVLADAIGQRAGRQVQMEQRNVAYEDQLLQQVSKTAAQEERNRMARDLHDSIKQQIFSIVVSAAAVKARWEHNPVSARTIVDDIERTALEAQVEMQAMLQQLRPTALENVGLLESLRMQCQALGYRTGAQVEAQLDDLPPEDLLPLGTQETIFRVVQEGFANIARHARASHVWISLYRQHNTLLVEIGDDGQGFDLSRLRKCPDQHGGMGLGNVRERVTALGGTVTVWSRPDRGTTLHLSIPLKVSSRQARVAAQELITKELSAVLQNAHRSLNVGMRIAELCAALALLYIPASIAGFGLFLCSIGSAIAWLWAQQYRMQASFDLATNHPQSYLLRAKSQGLLAGVLFLVALWPFYLIYPISYLFSQYSLLFMVAFGALILTILVMFILACLNMKRYYRVLPDQEKQESARRLARQTIVDWIAWVCALAIAFVLVNAGGNLSSYDAGLPIVLVLTLVAWLVVNLEKWWRVMRWRRQILKTQVHRKEEVYV